ncbi:Mdm31 protein [Martiniozyma asiatica (nom. inval.)]|nr:Mdm31 protein [Martiniozyma asiatica]
MFRFILPQLVKCKPTTPHQIIKLRHCPRTAIGSYSNKNIFFRHIITQQNRPILKSNFKGLIKRQLSNKTSQRLIKVINWFEDKWFKLKWILIRSRRPFNFEDLTAFGTWLLTGNIFLFLLGTTTFFSLVIFTINSMDMQSTITDFVGHTITNNTNLTFSSGSVVPDWKGGNIQFKNCVVNKRPKVIKTLKKNIKDLNGNIIQIEKEDIYDDGNYTQFDITIEEINFSLSFWKWISGKGFIDTASAKVVRGVVDRTHVVWKENDDPRNYKNIPAPGDWEIEKFKVEDVLLTITHPYEFRPCEISIYTAELPILRKNWLMLDFLTANHISGAYDGSLFTINQITNLDTFKEESKIDFLVNKELGREKFSKILNNGDNFKKSTRMRIDNLKIDNLNAGMGGPMGWITRGSVDMIADIMVLEESASLNEILTNEIFSRFNTIPQKPPREAEEKPIELENLFVCDFYLKLKNPKAQIPLFTDSMSTISTTAMRPIVGYINSKKTFIPIRCRIIKDLKDFDGAWTFYDSLFMPDLTEAVTNSFFEYAIDEKMRNERLRKVGFWSLQFFLQFVFWSLTTLNG